MNIHLLLYQLAESCSQTYSSLLEGFVKPNMARDPGDSFQFKVTPRRIIWNNSTSADARPTPFATCKPEKFLTFNTPATSTTSDGLFIVFF